MNMAELDTLIGLGVVPDLHLDIRAEKWNGVITGTWVGFTSFLLLDDRISCPRTNRPEDDVSVVQVTPS